MKHLFSVLFTLVLVLTITSTTFAQSPVPTPSPIPTPIVSSLTNCRITILDFETTSKITQYAALTNVKSLTIVTKVYVDNILVFDETNYLSFNRLFSGAYNYSFFVPKKLDSDRISVTNSFYIRNGGQSTYISNCNWAAIF
jgi:hypothetical protein